MSVSIKELVKARLSQASTLGICVIRFVFLAVWINYTDISFQIAGFRKREIQVNVAVKETDDNETEEIKKVKKVTYCRTNKNTGETNLNKTENIAK